MCFPRFLEGGGSLWRSVDFVVSSIARAAEWSSERRSMLVPRLWPPVRSPAIRGRLADYVRTTHAARKRAGRIAGLVRLRFGCIETLRAGFGSVVRGGAAEQQRSVLRHDLALARFARAGELPATHPVAPTARFTVKRSLIVAASVSRLHLRLHGSEQRSGWLARHPRRRVSTHAQEPCTRGL
jgi:hypothetical protein